MDVAAAMSQVSDRMGANQLAAILHKQGYTIKIRTSQSVQGAEHYFKNLKHTYIVAAPSIESDQIFIIDDDFKT